jgi:hypothetical protein
MLIERVMYRYHGVWQQRRPASVRRNALEQFWAILVHLTACPMNHIALRDAPT